MRKILLLVSIILMASMMGCTAFFRAASIMVSESPGESGESKEALEQKFLTKARAFERNGDLVASFKQFKLAAAVHPENQETIESCKRLKSALHRLAKEHYKTGLNLYMKGKYDLARREFLTALRLKPDDPDVIQILTSRRRIQTKRYVEHTVKPSETLSKLAQFYYGDYRRFPVIAKYNNLTDATNIRVGQKIKIPEVRGLPFLVPELQVNDDEKECADMDLPDLEEHELDQGKEDPSRQVKTTEEENPSGQAGFYRELGLHLFANKRYEEASEAFEKVIREIPEDGIGMEYAHRCHFERGMSYFKQKDYLSAKDQFEKSLLYKDDCGKCYYYIKRSEDLYKETHYKKGMQYFYAERLVEAINEWNLVKELDPQYKRVDYLINRAEIIMKKIERLKESAHAE